MKKLVSLLQTFRLHALASPVLGQLGAPKTSHAADDVVDLVFVTPPASAKGWILDAICREIGSRLPGLNVGYCSFGSTLPPAACYFYSHYMYFVGSLRLWPSTPSGRRYVFATHLESDKHRLDDRLLARLLNRSDGVICMNRAMRDALQALGVASAKLSVAVGAADINVFQPHDRRPDGTIGFCAAYYERKAPDRILEIVSALPSRHFVLLGQGWRRYGRFDELVALPNFKYLEVPYSEYPMHYAQMSVFVSASQLEGGPIPLLETMMANVVPVASRTGFAPDIIEHGRNGFLFDIAAQSGVICDLIEQALALQGDVRQSVERFDWAPFTGAVAAAMEIPPALLQR